METLNFGIGLAFGILIYEPMLTVPMGACTLAASELSESRDLRLFSFGLLSAGLSIGLAQELRKQENERVAENSPAPEQAAPAPQEEEVIEMKEVNGVYAPNL